MLVHKLRVALRAIHAAVPLVTSKCLSIRALPMLHQISLQCRLHQIVVKLSP
jgi:hypothetical protein